MNWTRIRTQLGKRGAIVGAGVAGFLVGAGGFVAAQIDDSPSAEIEAEVEMERTAAVAPSSTTADSVPDSSVTPTVVDLSVPDVTTDDSSSSSVPSNTTDDSSSSSVPSNTTDDSSSSSVPAALPAPFTRSYESFGGSIGVTWTGSAFVLDSVSPAAGFRAEIEDQSWDRIRVDFEGDDDDARIEVRLNDGQVRVRVD